VILATPVEVILEQLEEISSYLLEGTIVTDVGSVKSPIMERARQVLPEGVCFIGGHPIAGSEVSGVQAADPFVFKERVYVLCPFYDTPAEALLTLIEMAESLLSRPVTIEPEEHDRAMAMVSHVPQLLSVALFKAAVDDDTGHGMLDLLAGRGFLGLTRLAASDFNVWNGILKTNLPTIGRAFARFERSLEAVRSEMDRGELGRLWEPLAERRRDMGLERLPRMRLPEWRQLIDQCDEEILRALSHRMQVATRIGELKRQRESPVADPDRERRMMAKRHVWAKTLDVPTGLVDEMFDIIMKYSRQTQSPVRHGEPAEED
jgi:prephenate dehydrogenase